MPFWFFLKEKKQVFIKQKSIMESSLTMDSFTTIDGQYDPNFVNTNVEWLQEHMNHVDYAPRKNKKKPENGGVTKGVESFSDNIGVETDE
jgi:hypothetical protein